MHLYLHPRVKVIVVMVRFSILTIQTFTLLCALLPGTVAFTVIFAAFRFLTRAASHRHEGGDAFEGPRMSEVCHLLGLVNLELATMLIAATVAEAFLIAQSSFGEALAVHFKAIDLGALAALRGLLSRGQIERVYRMKYMIFFWIFCLINEQVKQVFAGCMPMVSNLQFRVGNELERSRRRRGTLGSHFQILTHQLQYLQYEMRQIKNINYFGS